MDTIANRVKTWDEHATIISGRFQTGKTGAVEEVVRGARGIFKHTVKDEHWEEKLYKSLQVDGPGMFESVLVRVEAELATLADPITKMPIILFEVPRTTTKGLPYWEPRMMKQGSLLRSPPSAAHSPVLKKQASPRTPGQ
ncbi:unnamed protein product [Symbiodinium sp. CCMP2592]|nr:unnamed protein product [Symbiodinium sp. CCMP2592]